MKSIPSKDIHNNYGYSQVFEHRKDIERAKDFINRAETSEKNLSDINSGKMKAGRDFIVQRDYNIYPIPVPIINTEKSLIIRRK